VESWEGGLVSGRKGKPTLHPIVDGTIGGWMWFGRMSGGDEKAPVRRSEAGQVKAAHNYSLYFCQGPGVKKQKRGAQSNYWRPVSQQRGLE